MSLKPKSFYPDVIVNAFKSVQAWKTVSLVILGAFIVQTIFVIYLAQHQTVLLIPQHLPRDKGAIKVDLGSPYSPDYMTGVAKGDIFALLSWTPQNIDTQYGMFLARLAPALYDAQREKLLSEKKSHMDEGLTQSFYVTRTFVAGTEVTLHGILVRSTGGKETFRGPASYTISYVDSGGGVLLVAGVRQPTDQEVNATEAAAKVTAANAKAAQAAN